MNNSPNSTRDGALRRALVAALGPSPVTDADLETQLDALAEQTLTDDQRQRILQASRSLIRSSSVLQPAVADSRLSRTPFPESRQEVTMRKSPGEITRHPTRGSVAAVLVSALCLAAVLISGPELIREAASPRGNVMATRASVEHEESPRVEVARLTPGPAVRPQPARVDVGDAISTSATERKRVVLPDDSVLYVNNNTAVRIESERRVALERGDVFVEVTPRRDALQRSELFEVMTPERTVTALGTRFSVSADNSRASVLVTQGAVKISGLADPVSAGQQVVIPASPRHGSSGTEAPPVILTAAPRLSAPLDWTQDLMQAAAGALVPASDFAGGALIAIDPQGQSARLSLRKYHVDVHIEDGFARTTIDQTYFNHTSSRLEGTFHFPLPPDASLSRLAMYVNGKLMEGGMAERNHARNTFEQIVSKMQDPALLEWVDGSLFRMRVFPLEPRQEKRIVLSYTQRLQRSFNKLTYRFPAGHTMDVVGEWSTAVRAVNGSTLTWESPSHTLTADDGGNDLILKGSLRNTTLDRDLVVQLKNPAQPESPQSDSGAGKEFARFSQVQHDDRDYLMLRLQPQIDRNLRRQPRHWVFLFESSGDRTPLLARTQIEIVRTLLENADHTDTFQIITANTRAVAMWDGGQPCDNRHVTESLSALEQTHLVGALDLEAALAGCVAAAATAKDGRQPVIVHVGSGYPALGSRDDLKLRELVPESCSYVGVGVGSRWNRALMKQLAEATSGHLTQINPDENVPWRAFDVYSTLNAPRLLNIRVTAGDADPSAPDSDAFLLFSDMATQGDEIAAVQRLEPGSRLPGSVTVHAVLDGQPWTRVIPVENVATDATYLPRMWARLEIERLLETDPAANRETIVELSKAMYVMSPFTSLLVLENDEMYTQFQIDRGRKDHWALYPCPDEIKVVSEPLTGIELPVVADTPATSPAATVLRIRRPSVMTFPQRVVQTRWYGNGDQGTDDFYLYFGRPAGDGLPQDQVRNLNEHFPLPGSDEFDGIAPDILESLLETPLDGRMRGISAFSLLQNPQFRLNETLLQRELLRESFPRSYVTPMPGEGAGRGDFAIPQGQLPEILLTQPMSEQRPQQNVRFIRSGGFGDQDFTLEGFAQPQGWMMLPSDVWRGDLQSGLRGQSPLLFSVIPRLPSDASGNSAAFEVLPQPDVPLSFSDFDLTGQDARRVAADVRMLGLRQVPAGQAWEFLGYSNDFVDRFDVYDGLRVLVLPEGREDNGRWMHDRAAIDDLQAINGFGSSVLAGTDWSKRRSELATLNQIRGSDTAPFFFERRSGESMIELIDQDAVRAELVRKAGGAGSGQSLHRWARQAAPTDTSFVRLPAFALTPAVEFGRNHAVFGDLLTMAPGLNSSTADLLAVFDAAQPPAQTGSVAAAARALIDRARSAGWESITLPSGGDKPGVTLMYDGAGRHVWQRVVSEGLTEQVICDGETQWHVYRDIGLASKRSFSRFHLQEMRRLVPWLLPAADDLARTADVVAVDERTVEIRPLKPVNPPESPKEAGLTSPVASRATAASPAASDDVVERLLFATDGRLAEQQFVTSEGTLLLKVLMNADGAVQVLNADGREIGRIELHRATVAPPELKPNLTELVCLPMPVRSANVVSEGQPVDDQGQPRYAEWSEDAALGLMLSDIASGDGSRTIAVGRQRFLNQGDQRAGIFVLLSRFPQQLVFSANPGGTEGDSQEVDLRPPVEGSPLKQFLRQYINWLRTNDDSADFELAGEPPAFLQQLVTARNLYLRWHTGRATTDRTDAQVESELLAVLEFASTCRTVEFGWTVLSAVAPRLQNNDMRLRYVEAARRYESSPMIAGLVRIIRVRTLIDADSIAEAATLFQEWHTWMLNQGLVPALDADICAVLRAGGGAEAWNRYFSTTAQSLIAESRFTSALMLSVQLRQQGDETTAAAIMDSILDKLPAANRPLTSLVVMEQLRQLQDVRAEQLFQQLSELPELSEHAAIWRYAATVADTTHHARQALDRLEKAIHLDFESRPRTINVETVNADYRDLLTRFDRLADAVRFVDSEPPTDLADRIVRAADQWRTLVDDDTEPCQMASRILTKLDRADSAWDYLTTPLAENSGESGPWQTLATALAVEERIDQADRAWDQAFELEQTNPDILLAHARMLQERGRNRKARSLVQQIVAGTWQPRFSGTVSQAQQLLTQLPPQS